MFKFFFAPREFFGGLCLVDGAFFLICASGGIGILAALPYLLV